MGETYKADVVICGAGLSGLVAACEAADRGRKVLMLDQEGPQNLGGQAFWSLGGLFMVDTPEQRRMGIKDSHALAMNDWLGSAQFDRPEDANPRKMAEAFVDFAATEMRPWLQGLGLRWFPVVGWAERGGSFAHGHGNSVPRFHITWGIGPAVLRPFINKAVEHSNIEIKFRHRVTGLDLKDGGVSGVTGEILAPSTVARGAASSRDVTGDFRAEGQVVVTSGGIGGNFDLVRASWPTDRLGTAPQKFISGVPEHVDGLLQQTVAQAGAQMINTDRMWHYCEGITNWNPIWPHHGIRILPGPSSLWFDALGQRLEAPFFPGYDTLGTLCRILSTGHGHSWFILTQKVIEKEFALSGSEQNPDLAAGKWSAVLRQRFFGKATSSVAAFKEKGEDFVVAAGLEELVAGMNRLTPDAPLDAAKIRAQVEARDAQVHNKFSKDLQVTALHGARRYLGDRLIRTTKPHRFLDPANGPLIAVRLNILTRKSLGGLHTDPTGQVLRHDGSGFDGLFAAGEAAGFGGGGYHGYNALEGTFLGGCLFSGRAVGRVV
ncbi:Fumarate/succinate/L-aspartate dehydrogenase [Candidatus Rhodobacter oscarellae]|uniref:Fumarate/succinate/L-aspartate dehydrogenase n=1 Tax=Candidatus Rhodobacter oscarellae TaxID=1675527 RepID=A0A0J9H143_9RHOB|nr:FAD-binding dehydrogenase [Candidatus Rhodobacter lobularis]KMW59458.1 Fumarate/succinate/L-aspartate dehydrogenase [Candidatus Rhodobacter lobularis]